MEKTSSSRGIIGEFVERISRRTPERKKLERTLTKTLDEIIAKILNEYHKESEEKIQKKIHNKYLEVLQKESLEKLEQECLERLKQEYLINVRRNFSFVEAMFSILILCRLTTEKNIESPEFYHFPNSLPAVVNGHSFRHTPESYHQFRRLVASSELSVDVSTRSFSRNFL